MFSKTFRSFFYCFSYDNGGVILSTKKEISDPMLSAKRILHVKETNA